MTNNKKQTAVDWFYDKIKSHFEHDGDLLETLTFTMAIAKQKEKEQIEDAFDNVSWFEHDDQINESISTQYYNATYKEGSHE